MKHIHATYRNVPVVIRSGTSMGMFFLCWTVTAHSLHRGGQWEFIQGKWDLIVAHPPCTELCSSGQRWFTEGVKHYDLQRKAISFFYKFVIADCKHIAIENPIGVMSTAYRKPDCIINPWQFGHPEQKQTCLWLKNLPVLHETDNVYNYMMTLPEKERARIWWLGSNHGKERSKTYPGIAKAMAEQWGNLI